MTAINRNLLELAAAGPFREDLLYRLNVIHLPVPPLRERPADVTALTKHFLARAGRELTFTDDAMRAFLKCGWPGNVRELRNVVEQLVWLSPSGVVEMEHLPASMHRGPALIVPLDDRRQVSDDLYDAVVKQGSRSGTMSTRCSCRATSRGRTCAIWCVGD